EPERHQVGAHAVVDLLVRRRDLEVELALVGAVRADLEPIDTVGRAGGLHGLQRVRQQPRVDQVAAGPEHRDDLVLHAGERSGRAGPVEPRACYPAQRRNRPMRAGLPAATAPGGTAKSTTAPAPTIASSPMQAPGSSTARAPIHALRPISMLGGGPCSEHGDGTAAYSSAITT